MFTGAIGAAAPPSASCSALLPQPGGQQIHVMIGAIDVANTASIALHEKLGFAWAGTIKEVAFKFGGWLDLAFYQRILETPRQPVDG
jgi:L-amino acid N-acyltransferase YncA